ncbi:Calcium-transporting ATPase, partial [Quillaja saponaria]
KDLGSFDVRKATLQFIDASDRAKYKLSEDAREAGFDIDPDEIASIVRSHDFKSLKIHGGAEAIVRKLSVSLNDGVSENNVHTRQQFL